GLLADVETAFLAMMYHDVVYFMPDGTNEEKSAMFAHRHLVLLGYPETKVRRCQELIMATKTHAGGADIDIDYFVDADMAILGSDWATYNQYAGNIRKEYGDTPQFDSGRRAVLKHFLGMDRLFKTDLFFERFEAQARQNITVELQTLQGGSFSR